MGCCNFKEEDRALIDTEVATLTAGWSRHSFIKNKLSEKGISLTPLMLVQVEDQQEGKEIPVARVKERLIEIGVPEQAIAVHTSGEPDPAFHTLAYDPEIEVLIFKLAVATGFDAARLDAGIGASEPGERLWLADRGPDHAGASAGAPVAWKRPAA